MKSILAVLAVLAFAVPALPTSANAGRDPRVKPAQGSTGTRAPREKPGNTGGDKGGTRPPREKPGTGTGGGSGGDAGNRPEEHDHPIIPPPYGHPRPGICEYRYVDYDRRPLPSSAGNPLMDTYQLAIATTLVTNSVTLFTDGNVRGVGVAGIVVGAVSLVAAPFRHDRDEQMAFAMAGLASIVLGALNLDERHAYATSVPYRDSPAFVSISF